MYLIGLTGGIGTGKSAVSSILYKRKYAIIDADLVARSVAEPGKRANKRIREEFGDEFFHTDGRLDREKLALVVFSDPEKRRKLDSIIHPEITKKIVWLIIGNALSLNRFIFLDTPLLYETRMDRFVQKVVVVACDENVQIERVMRRDGIGEEEAKRRISAQMPLAEKVRRADFVIENNGTLEELEQKVDQMLNFIQSKWTKFVICLSAISIAIIFVVISCFRAIFA